MIPMLEYTKTASASLKFRLINQRADFSIALFSGGLSNVSHCLFFFFFSLSCTQFYSYSSNNVFNIMQMAVTWTSGYNIIDAVPFVEWGFKGESQTQSPAGTLTFHCNAMCGMIYVLFLLSYCGDFNHQCNPLLLRKALPLHLA